MLIISDVIKFSPFGNISPLVADTSVQFEVYVSYLKSVFFGDNDLFYTFSKTLGGDMAGFSFYYLGNPFLYLLVFLPNEWMPAGILGVIVLLMALSSLNFNIMLNKIYGFRWSSLLFSLSFAFMGYFTAYYNFIIYFNNIMLLPLIILGLYEMVNKEKKNFKYIIFLSLSIITNYYIGYMTCIFCFLFFLYLLVVQKKEYSNVKKYLYITVTFIWESLLAVMISAVALFTVFYSLQSGQKIGNGYGLKFEWGTNFRLSDVFTGFYTISFNGNISNGLPIIYIGTLGVVFAILFFMNREIRIREKIFSAVMILIFIGSFYIKYFNRIWHGLAETVGFPYRYSFFFSFFLLYIAYKGFILMKQGTRKYHTIIVFILFVLYSLYMYVSNSQYVCTLQIILTGAFLCMYLVGIYAICYKREYMYPITIGFFMILSFDLLLNCHYSILKYYIPDQIQESTVERYDDYYNTLIEIKNRTIIDNGRTDDLYRIEKLFRMHHNDAMLASYNGLSHFSSTESSTVLKFMDKLGFCTNNMWSYYGEDGNTTFADCLFNVKYYISQFDTTEKPYELVDIIDNKYIFKNPYTLEIAFAASDEINNIDFEKYNHFTLQNEIAETITGKPYGIYRPVEVVDVNLENVEKYEKTYTRIDSNKEAYIEYMLKINSPDFIFMYFDAPGNQEAKIEVKDLGKRSYFTTYSWSIKGAGYFNIGEIVPVRIYLEQDEIEIDGYEFYYESEEELKRWYEDAVSSNISINKLSSSHLNIEADIKEGEEEIVMTIPYDKGWHVYIDGIETEIEPVMSALLSYKITPGEHHIVMRYIPQGFIAGLFISIIGIVILLTLYIIERIRIRKLLKGTK